MSTTTEKLGGKIALVTGGTSGIGLATAQRFVAEGAQVFITGRSQNDLDQAVKEIGDSASGVQGDISNLSDLDRLFNTIKQKAGRLDILFANAGLGEFMPLGQITEAHFDKIFGVNVKARSSHESTNRSSRSAGSCGYTRRDRQSRGVPSFG